MFLLFFASVDILIFLFLPLMFPSSSSSSYFSIIVWGIPWDRLIPKTFSFKCDSLMSCLLKLIFCKKSFLLFAVVINRIFQRQRLHRLSKTMTKVLQVEVFGKTDFGMKRWGDTIHFIRRTIENFIKMGSNTRNVQSSSTSVIVLWFEEASVYKKLLVSSKKDNDVKEWFCWYKSRGKDV